MSKVTFICVIALSAPFFFAGCSHSKSPDVREIVFDPSRSDSDRANAIRLYICSRRSCGVKEKLVVESIANDGFSLDITIRAESSASQPASLPWNCSVTNALLGCNFEMLPILEELRGPNGQPIGYAGVYEGRPNCDWSKPWTPKHSCPSERNKNRVKE
jgi:hypothetical protein